MKLSIFDILHFKGVYVAASTYAVGDVVASGIDYISLISGNTGNTPSTSPADWAPLAAASPTGIGAEGPIEFVSENGPVALSSVGASVTLVSLAVPAGVYLFEGTVGGIAIEAAGMGSVSTIQPLTLVSASEGKYEGIFAVTAGSGIALNTTQGPGWSSVARLVAKPVVTA